MGRKSNDSRLDEICAFLQGHPDEKPGTMASALGLDNKAVMRALTQLEDRGDLFQEDDRGCLRWFGRRQ